MRWGGGGTFPVSVTTAASMHHNQVNIAATRYESEQVIKVHIFGGDKYTLL
jgi:hypothetical protein